MTAHLKPDVVDATPAQLHLIECVPNAATTTVWSGAHLARDRGKAVRLLDGLAGVGWNLSRIDYYADAS